MRCKHEAGNTFASSKKFDFVSPKKFNFKEELNKQAIISSQFINYARC
jgi:hypothetical protein